MGGFGGARLAGEGPVFSGVRLEQHAGVTAALAEGVALGDVLAQERIEGTAWAAADRAWKEALVDAPDLQLRYMRLRRQAEDCLSRPIEPLDDDPAAWAGLLGALASSGEPDRMLESLGLRMTDVGRLGRSWRAKAEKDPAVADRLSALAGKATPPKAVRCGPALLRPFPWTPRADSTTAPAAPPKADIPPASLPATSEAPEPGHTDDRQLLPSYLAAQLQAPAIPVAVQQAAGPTPAPEAPAWLPMALRGITDVEGTLLAPEGATAQPALPFDASASPKLPAPAEKAAQVPMGTRPRATLEPNAEIGATLAGAVPARGPALPFTGKSDISPPTAGKPAAPSVRSPLEPRASMDETALLSGQPAAPPLPFEPPRPRATLEPSADLAATQLFSGERGISPPAAGKTAAASVRWSPEDYGRFCVELDAASNRRSVLERWSVSDEAQLAALQREWRDRFVADLSARDRFLAAMKLARGAAR